jgi:hypothetical protein
MAVDPDEETPNSELEADSAIGDSLLRAIVATPSSIETSASLAIDALIDGQYRVSRRLGHGGMGVVYLAHDERLGRDVAIKIGRAATPEVLKRLAHEARALARLSHPNVVTIFQIGAVDGCPYIAMEYVAGGTMREWLKAKPRNWREIVAMYAAAGDGLAAAHAAGLVHRDFKPDNVLVGDDGRPRVADFGVVGGLGRGVPDPANATETGIVGTPAYMAPEQFEGAAVDERADQFAFCASMWEALFGERPRDDMAPVPRTGVPRDLEATLRCGLARDREQRWPSIAALVGAIRRRPRTWWRYVAVAVVLLGGGGAVAMRSIATPGCPSPDQDALYVAADAHAGGNGTQACPFRTIDAALAVSHTGPMTIHVGAGRYDRDHGEHFPLVVRGDTSVVGAGADATRVIGGGTVAWAYGASVPNVVATFEVGDARGRTDLAAMSIEGVTATPESGRFAILCDRGNLHEFSGDPPPANTHLSGMLIGPGFDNAIIATSTYGADRSGCNLAMVGSRVKGSYTGVWTTGCSDDKVDVPIRAEIGDGTDAGRNWFISIRNPQGSAVAVNAWDCTRELLLRRNNFEDSDTGLVITRHPPATGTSSITHNVVEHNRFDGITTVAISLRDVASIDVLDGNVFWRDRGLAARATAIRLDPAEQKPPYYPSIFRARHNKFARNDIGLDFRGTELLAESPVDFGRPDDPGDNTFSCNSSEHDDAPGFDVRVDVAMRGAPLQLAGNHWDHAPPTIGRDRVNGTDIEVGSGSAVLDVSGATETGDDCAQR